MIDLEKFKKDYNWTEAIAVACRDAIEPAPPTADVDLSPFTIDNVAHVQCAVDGENEEAEWAAVLVLNDGRVVTIEAGCDYTGWG